jgi:hypothetical protein
MHFVIHYVLCVQPNVQYIYSKQPPKHLVWVKGDKFASIPRVGAIDSLSIAATRCEEGSQRAEGWPPMGTI